MKKWTIFHWYVGHDSIKEIPVLYDKKEKRYYLGGSSPTIDYLLFEKKLDAEDVISMAFLIGGFWVNVNYIGSKAFSIVIVVLFLLRLIAWGQSKKNVFTDVEEAIKYLKS